MLHHCCITPPLVNWKLTTFFSVPLLTVGINMGLSGDLGSIRRCVCVDVVVRLRMRSIARTSTLLVGSMTRQKRNLSVAECLDDGNRKGEWVLDEKKVLEELGFEPRTFSMRSRHSTTELHPQLLRWANIAVIYVPAILKIKN